MVTRMYEDRLEGRACWTYVVEDVRFHMHINADIRALPHVHFGAHHVQSWPSVIMKVTTQEKQAMKSR